MPGNCEKELKKAVDKTKDNTGLSLVLALSYSSKSEIVGAVKKIAKDVSESKININEITDDIFNGYNPLSYSTYGNYVPESSTTYTSNNYVLETVVYNLDETGDNQLVAVVTSRIEDPENATKTAKQYVKAITKSFDNK